MKKAFAMALAAMLAFALAGCVTTVKEEKPTMSASEQSVSSSSSAASSSSSGTDSNLTQSQVEDIVFEQGIGEFVSATPYQGSDGQWYRNLAANDVNNETRYYIVDPNGNVSDAG